tara:strand:+ start:1080 stop:1343 length:264 start_codon:yes stop_codon:yes gene_type:complete
MMTQEATIIEFKNDDQRAMFQLRMALVMLQSEVRIGMPITSRAKANTLHVIKRHMAKIAPELKLSRVKKTAYNQLVEAGVYNIIENN